MSFLFFALACVDMKRRCDENTKRENEAFTLVCDREKHKSNDVCVSHSVFSHIHSV